VVKDAEVVEYGTHDVLLKKGGVYADLWAIQAAGGALASS
jgi:ABC-type multidrug transport system fused ATPase/permease subunit